MADRLWIADRLTETSLFQWFRRLFSPSHEYALLWALAQAVEQQQPLDKTLLAVASDLPEHWARRIRQVAELIAEGVSLPGALERVPGTIGESSLLAIQVGAASGSLAETLRDETARLQTVERCRRSAFIGILFQFLVMGLLALCLMGFLTVFLLPRYKKIYEELGVGLPSMLDWVWSWVSWYWRAGLITVPITLLAIWFVSAVALLLDSRLTRGQRMFPEIRRLPWIGRMFLRLEVARILRWFAIAVRRGRPLSAILEAIQWHQRDGRLMTPLNQAARVIEQGGDCWDGLQAARLLSQRESVLLQSAQRAGNLPWALDEMSRRIERRVDDRCRLIFECLRPVVLGMVAAIVALYAVCFFMPLVHMVHELL